MTPIKAVKDGTFKGGTYVGTLENNGVGLAPFHEFEAKVPQTLKDELKQLAQDIIAGKIWTGWGEKPAASSVPRAAGAPWRYLQDPGRKGDDHLLAPAGAR